MPEQSLNLTRIPFLLPLSGRDSVDTATVLSNILLRGPTDAPSCSSAGQPVPDFQPVHGFPDLLGIFQVNRLAWRQQREEFGQCFLMLLPRRFMVTVEMTSQVALGYARPTLHTDGEPELAVELNVPLHLISTFKRECGILYLQFSYVSAVKGWTNAWGPYDGGLPPFDEDDAIADDVGWGCLIEGTRVPTLN